LAALPSQWTYLIVALGRIIAWMASKQKGKGGASGKTTSAPKEKDKATAAPTAKAEKTETSKAAEKKNAPPAGKAGAAERLAEKILGQLSEAKASGGTPDASSSGKKGKKKKAKKTEEEEEEAEKETEEKVDEVEIDEDEGLGTGPLELKNRAPEVSGSTCMLALRRCSVPARAWPLGFLVQN
jgi:hypothetical protein